MPSSENGVTPQETGMAFTEKCGAILPAIRASAQTQVVAARSFDRNN
jgi:hypothetical protein